MFEHSRTRVAVLTAWIACFNTACLELLDGGDDAGAAGEGGGAAGEGGGGGGGGGGESPSPNALAEVVNRYRQEQGLEVVPISGALTLVAEAHVQDLVANSPASGPCNLHSWSDAGPWSACCYTDDHAEAQCMWDKPGELSTYSGYGYEIAYVSSGGATAEGALAGWISSSGHHDVILNRGPWSDRPWGAMGAAMQGAYAVVWFGEESN